jgi:hypothetical protein
MSLFSVPLAWYPYGHMRKLGALALLWIAIASPLESQQWGTWTPGRGAFGDWHWASPVADVAALELLTGAPGECIAVMDAGAVYCWSGDSSSWVAAGGGTDTDDQTAAEVPITDGGGYYTGTQVEAMGQEIGASLAGKAVGVGSSAAHTFALFADTAGKALEASTWGIFSNVLTSPSGGKLLLPGAGRVTVGDAFTGLRIDDGEIKQQDQSLDIHTVGSFPINIYTGSGPINIGPDGQLVHVGGTSGVTFNAHTISTASNVDFDIDPGGTGNVNVVAPAGLFVGGQAAVTTDDPRLNDARTPTAHSSTHRHGGSDEIAAVTPAANAIPKAGAGGTIAAGWVPTLNQDTTGNAATATTAATASDVSCTGCLTAADLGTDSVAASELDAGAVESELESVLDLQDQQGAVTDAQVPDSITASNYAPLAGGTFTGTVGVDNGQGFRLFEADANGSNYVEFVAPSVLTSNTTCTLENDGNPIPDSCVGDGTDANGGISGLGSVDNRIVRSDGTAGTAAQNSTVGLTDAGVMSFPDAAGTRANGSTTSNAVRFYGALEDFSLYMGCANGGGLCFYDGSNSIGMESGRLYLPTGGDVRFNGSDTAFGYVSSGVGKIYNPAGGAFAELQVKADTVATTNTGFKSCTYSTELLTLSTAGATTDTSASLAPATSRVEAITYRITTTIATATAFTVKVKGGNSFCSVGTATTSQTTLTSGTTGVLVPCAFADQYNTAAAKLTIDTTGTPSAGIVRLQLHSCAFTAPTS